MAAPEGSEDFDLAGVNASDGDDDFDWASLDEPEQQQSAAPTAAAGFTTTTGAIPFQGAAPQPVPASATQSAAAGISNPASAVTQPAGSTPAAKPSAPPAPRTAPTPNAGPSGPPEAAASPAEPLSAPPVQPGSTSTPSPAAPSLQSRLGPGVTATPEGKPSPVMPSAPGRSSPGIAATPPAPRYAARPQANSPAAAGAVGASPSAGPAVSASPVAAAAKSPATAAGASPVTTVTSSTATAGQRPATATGAGSAGAAALPSTQGSGAVTAQQQSNKPVQQSQPPAVKPTPQAAASSPQPAKQLVPGQQDKTPPATAVSADKSAAPTAEQQAAPSASAAPAEAATATARTPAAPASSSSQTAKGSSSNAGPQQQPGGGWGWGFGGLSSKLQQVALGAAKDLQELTASVQQAYAEVVASDDVSEVDRLSAYQVHPSKPPPPPRASTAPPAAMAASRDSQGQLPTIHEPETGEEVVSPSAFDAEEAKRQAVLSKLGGDDTQLEAGLKAIDDQVEVLAASAAKAIGSLWGGFSNVAKTGWTVGHAITTKVEAAAKEVAKELVVEGAPVLSLAERLAATAEKGLESVGRVGASLLDAQFAHGGSHHSRTPSDWASTFDSCFELYGGSQAAEELEQLSSECAGICNRARAKLQQEHREQIDRTLAKLVPAFDLRSQQQQDQTVEADGSSAEKQQQQQQINVSEAMQEGLEHMYLPVAALCNKGKYRAEQLQQEAESSAPDAVSGDVAATEPSPPAAAAAAAAGDADEIQPDAEPAANSDEGRSQGSSSGQVEVLLDQLMSSLRSAAVKSLAEVSAGQLMMLLALGRSVAAVPRYGKPMDDGLDWPAEPDQVAAVMKHQVQLMLEDIQQLAGTFKATAPLLLNILQAAASKVAAAAGAGAVVSKFLGSDAGQKQASLVVEEVAVDCNTAVRHLTDGFGKLLYVVLLSSLHSAGQPAAAAGSGVDESVQVQ